jgi:hypothetical protein
MVPSINRFIKKRVIKNILFMTKRSRLVIKISGPDLYGKNKMAAMPPFDNRTLKVSKK